MMASIDIVIPCYQYGRFLRECVHSVLSQGIADLRILIIDNASTDDSVEIARDLSAKDSRIFLTARERNLGPQASFNEGIDWARSDYFALLHADDLLAPRALRHAVDFMERHRTVAFAFGKDFLFVDGKKSGDAFAELNNTAPSWKILSGRQFVKEGELKTVGPIVRTRIQKRAGYFHPDLPMTDDAEMLMRLACYGDVAKTLSPLVMQRLHGANISAALWKDPMAALKQDEATIEIFFQNEGRRFGTRLHHRARRNLGKRAYWSAMKRLAKGKRAEAMHLLAFAFRLCPSARIIPPVDYLIKLEAPLAAIGSAVQSLTLKRPISS
jgi:glycosyltransferase involved in cell wall biosynthesis